MVFFLLLSVLVAAGCGEAKKVDEQKKDVDSVNIETSDTDSNNTETSTKAESLNTQVNIGVTEQEVNKLKQDVEKMEFDDLNAVSN